jgi:hypothetical protein
MNSTTLHVAPPVELRRLRPSDWIGYATAVWAAAYAIVALVWTASGQGYPFGRNDPDNHMALLRFVPPEAGAPLFAGVLLATVVVATVMAARHPVHVRPAPRAALLAFGWAVAGVLVVAVPTVSFLALTGYAPMLLIGAPFGWPHGVDYGHIFTWSLANQAICLTGGVLLAGTVLAWQRRTRGACASCGRGAAHARGPAGGRGGPAHAAREIPIATVGRWATGVAVAIPLVYALTRYAWVVGIPLTINRQMLDDLHRSGGVWAGAGLATFAVAGSVLTLGLVQRWGEVFPRWIPWLRGRRVPVKLAVIPATYVSLIVTSAGIGLLSGFGQFEEPGVSRWVLLPSALWPVWGLALGAATYAYHLRRRGACRACGRDD